MNNKALIVIDMQKDFIDGSLGTPEAETIVDGVVEEIKEKKREGYDIFATKDTHQTDYLKSLEGTLLPVEHCIENTPGWEIESRITDEIKPENIFTKPTFGSIDLMNYLRENEPEEIELVGLCTDICVLANAVLLRTQFPDKRIVVKSDLCAGTSPELHDNALNVLKSCQIEVN